MHVAQALEEPIALGIEGAVVGDGLRGVDEALGVDPLAAHEPRVGPAEAAGGQRREAVLIGERREQRRARGEQPPPVGIGAEALEEPLAGVARERVDQLEDLIGALGIGDQRTQSAPGAAPLDAPARRRGGEAGEGRTSLPRASGLRWRASRLFYAGSIAEEKPMPLDPQARAVLDQIPLLDDEVVLALAPPLLRQAMAAMPGSAGPRRGGGARREPHAPRSRRRDPGADLCPERGPRAARRSSTSTAAAS